MLTEAILFAATLIPAIIWFRSKPPKPPGPLAKLNDQFSYKQSLILMSKNKNFVKH